MGSFQSTANNCEKKNGQRALNMLKARPNLYKNNTDNNLSVKFSRNDLVDSVSALSLGTAIRPMNGGGAHYSDNNLHPNAPNKQSYLKYLSTKTMDINGGGALTLSSGIVNNLSSESEGDWNNIKSMLIRGQSGGCGCDAAASVLQKGGNPNLSASSFDLSFSNSQSTMSAGSPQGAMYGGNTLSATSPMNNSATSPMNNSTQYGGNTLSATSPMNNSTQYGGNTLSATSPMNNSAQYGGNTLSASSSSSIQNINYEMLLGGKKTNKDSSSSSTETVKDSSTSLSDIDASSSSSTSTTMSGSSPDKVIKRALSKNAPSETTRELKRMETSEKKEKSSSSSSSSSSNSLSSNSSSSSSMSSSSSEGNEAYAKITRYDNVLLTSEGSANNVINVKQFYSTESGDLFSASSNFLRNNINKNRLR